MSSTKIQIIKLLESNPGAFLSGQMICEELGVSRTAVWKHIKDLQEDGYQIESLPRKGYQLIKIASSLTKERILAGLKTRELGQHLSVFSETPSTQKIAHHLAEDGAEHGTVVIADEQTNGRGRLGRQWSSPKGEGISMTLILRPDLQIRYTPQLTLLASVAVIKGIQEVTGAECGIKWPNDILFEGKKLVGILTELQAEGANVKAVIIGIGINVNTEDQSFPEELRRIACSLKTITGKEWDRVAIIQAILKHFETLYHLYLEDGFDIIKSLWETYALSLGKIIYARINTGEVIKGLAKGINEDGVLLLEDGNGKLHHIYSADIDL
jgi:BirA family biotin operon repressor/biotin-[acetyl-CoA-carboxylase] ligase